MEKDLGYSQMRFNYITDYANSINEQAVQMEMAWQYRNNFNGDVDVDKWLQEHKQEMEKTIESFKKYLQPLDNKN